LNKKLLQVHLSNKCASTINITLNQLLNYFIEDWGWSVNGSIKGKSSVLLGFCTKLMHCI